MLKVQGSPEDISSVVLEYGFYFIKMEVFKGDLIARSVGNPCLLN